MAKPTEPQIRLLTDLGIDDPPPTKAACRTTITFILEGNGAGTFVNQYQRAAFFKSHQEKWIYRQVEDTLNKTTGRVKYLLAKSSGEVTDEKRWKNVEPHPLTALVTFEKDVVQEMGWKISTQRLSLGRLRIIGE